MKRLLFVVLAALALSIQVSVSFSHKPKTLQLSCFHVYSAQIPPADADMIADLIIVVRRFNDSVLDALATAIASAISPTTLQANWSVQDSLSRIIRALATLADRVDKATAKKILDALSKVLDNLRTFYAKLVQLNPETSEYQDTKAAIEVEAVSTSDFGVFLDSFVLNCYFVEILCRENSYLLLFDKSLTWLNRAWAREDIQHKLDSLLQALKMLEDSLLQTLKIQQDSSLRAINNSRPLV